MNGTLDQQRPAITKMQVVIVAFIVLIILGFLVMAMRQWWENARLVRCMNNLKTLGELTAICESENGFLPPSRIDKGYATWPVLMGKYLPEETGDMGLRKWQLRQTYYAQPEQTRQSQNYLFYCPERRSPPQNSISGDVPSWQNAVGQHYPGALGDYAACAGDASSLWKTPEANGAIIPAVVDEKKDGRVLKWHGQLQLEALPRGQSATLLLGEKHVPYGRFGQAEFGDGSIYNGDYVASFSRLAGKGHPLATSLDSKFENNFGSYHPGICQFLMADGTVKRYSNDVATEVLGKLANRHLHADGKQVGE